MCHRATHQQPNVSRQENPAFASRQIRQRRIICVRIGCVEAGKAQSPRQFAEMNVGDEADGLEWPRPNAGVGSDIECHKPRENGDSVTAPNDLIEADGQTVDENQVNLRVGNPRPLNDILDRRMTVNDAQPGACRRCAGRKSLVGVREGLRPSGFGQQQNARPPHRCSITVRHRSSTTPFDFHRGRHLAAGDREFGGDQGEALDRLEWRQRFVHCVHRFLKEGEDVRAGNERVARAARSAHRGEPALERGKVRHEQRRNELAALAEQDSLCHERVAPEFVLNRLRGNLFADRSQDEVLPAVSDRQIAFVVERPDVTRVEPAVRFEHGPRRLRVVVVSAHDVRSAREDLAIAGDPQLNARQRAAHGSELGPVERVDGRQATPRQPTNWYWR
jgi:hypothetical protein